MLVVINASIYTLILGTLLLVVHWMFALGLTYLSFRVGSITINHVEHITSIVVTTVVMLLSCCASLLG